MLTVVQRIKSGQTAGNNSVVLPAVVAGNLIHVGVQTSSAVAPVVTDSNGNTYVKTPGSPIAGSNFEYIFYAKNVNAGATLISVTAGAGETFCTVVAYEISGADLVAPLQNEQKATGSGTAVATPPLTLGGVDCLIAAQMVFSPAGILIPGAGFTAGVQDDFNFIWDEYKATNIDQGALATLPALGSWGIIAAAYKAPGVVIPPVVTPPVMGGGINTELATVIFSATTVGVGSVFFLPPYGRITWQVVGVSATVRLKGSLNQLDFAQIDSATAPDIKTLSTGVTSVKGELVTNPGAGMVTISLIAGGNK